MTIELLIIFNLTLLVALASPGPAMLVTIKATLTSGKRTGIAIGLGLATMAAVWTCMAMLGLEAIFQLFPWAYTIVKITGALYLIYIAWMTWRGARDPIKADQTQNLSAFCDGLLVNLLNPKSVFFAAAVLLVIFPPDMSFLAKGIVVLNHFIIEIVFYGLLAHIMSTEKIKNAYLKTKVYFDRTASVVLGGLGLRLLISK